MTEVNAKINLNNTISLAKDLYNSFKNSTNPEVKAAAEELKQAIDEAQIIANDNFRKLDDVAAKNELEKAMDKAKNKVEAATVDEATAKKNLNNVINDAMALYDRIKDDPDVDDIAEELKQAIDKAQKTADNDALSKLDYVIAKNKLEKAFGKAVEDYNNRMATAIDGIIVEENHDKVEDAWYDLDGRKFDRKPVQKGLYIYKGKKVMLK